MSKPTVENPDEFQTYSVEVIQSAPTWHRVWSKNAKGALLVELLEWWELSREEQLLVAARLKVLHFPRFRPLRGSTSVRLEKHRQFIVDGAITLPWSRLTPIHKRMVSLPEVA